MGTVGNVGTIGARNDEMILKKLNKLHMSSTLRPKNLTLICDHDQHQVTFCLFTFDSGTRYFFQITSYL